MAGALFGAGEPAAVIERIPAGGVTPITRKLEMTSLHWGGRATTPFFMSVTTTKWRALPSARAALFKLFCGVLVNGHKSKLARKGATTFAAVEPSRYQICLFSPMKSSAVPDCTSV